MKKSGKTFHAKVNEKGERERYINGERVDPQTFAIEMERWVFRHNLRRARVGDPASAREVAKQLAGWVESGEMYDAAREYLVAALRLVAAGEPADKAFLIDPSLWRPKGDKWQHRNKTEGRDHRITALMHHQLIEQGGKGIARAAEAILSEYEFDGITDSKQIERIYKANRDQMYPK